MDAARNRTPIAAGTASVIVGCVGVMTGGVVGPTLKIVTGVVSGVVNVAESWSTSSRRALAVAITMGLASLAVILIRGDLWPLVSVPIAMLVLVILSVEKKRQDRRFPGRSTEEAFQAQDATPVLGPVFRWSDRFNRRLYGFDRRSLAEDKAKHRKGQRDSSSSKEMIRVRCARPGGHRRGAGPLHRESPGPWAGVTNRFSRAVCANPLKTARSMPVSHTRDVHEAASHASSRTRHVTIGPTTASTATDLIVATFLAGASRHN